MATKNNFLDFLIVRILSQVFNRTKVNIIAQMTLISKPSKSSSNKKEIYQRTKITNKVSFWLKYA